MVRNNSRERERDVEEGPAGWAFENANYKPENEEELELKGGREEHKGLKKKQQGEATLGIR